MDSGDCSPPPGSLCVDQTVIYDLYCPVPDVVHPLHPQHLILRLELFGDALTLCHLFYQQEHLLRRLLVDVVKVGIQPAAGQQFRVQGFISQRFTEFQQELFHMVAVQIGHSRAIKL